MDPVISWGIVTINAEAKIVKWTILEKDFSVVGRELGERARPGKKFWWGHWHQRPWVLI